MRFASFVLLLLSIPPAVWSQAAGAGGSPAGIIRDCAESADPALVGLDALDAACPELRQALVDSGYLLFVSSAQQQVLAPDQLVELQNMFERYREPPRSTGIEVASLDRVLRSLKQQHESERPLTWVERLRKWLRGLMDRQGEEDSWLAQWLDDVTVAGAVSRVISYVSIILVICLALVAIINELRVAGLLRRRRATEAAKSADGGRRSVPIHATAADPDAIAAGDRAPMLLRELVATLVRTGRLRAERSLTHRELGLRASFDAVDQRECFQRVAALAERVVYGGSHPRAGEFEDLLEAGRALNVKLGGAA